MSALTQLKVRTQSLKIEEQNAELPQLFLTWGVLRYRWMRIKWKLKQHISMSTVSTLFQKKTSLVVLRTIPSTRQQMDALSDYDPSAVISVLGTLLLTYFAKVLSLQAERCSENSLSLQVLPPVVPFDLSCLQVCQFFDLLSCQKYMLARHVQRTILPFWRTSFGHSNGTLETVSLHWRMCKGMMGARLVKLESSVRLDCISAGDLDSTYSLLEVPLLSFRYF